MPSDVATGTPPRSLIAMACIGAGVLLFEVMLTRVLAVALFSHLAFAVIALALMGIALGGWLAARHESLPARVRVGRARIALFIAGIAALAAVAFVAWVALVPDVVHEGDKLATSFSERRRAISADPFQLNIVAIAIASALQLVPFAGASYAQSLCFAAAPRRAGPLYAADVGGACAGALAALVLLPVLGGTNAIGAVIALFATAGWLIPWAIAGDAQTRPRIDRAAAVLLAVAAVVMVARPIALQHTAGFPEGSVVDTEWTPLARVSLFDAGEPKADGSMGEPWLLVDNTSRSRVVFVGDRQSRNNLDRLASALRPAGDVLIIGAGGGIEIAGALATSATPGERHIDAVEVADGMQDLMWRHFGDRPDFLLKQPGVQYHIADGRSYVQYSERRWSIIELKEVNFHSVAGQVASTWSPSLLFTVEAFHAYLDHLTSDGLLSIVKYHATSSPTSTARLLSSLRAAADERGIDLRDRVLIVDRKYWSGYREALLVSAAPLSDGDLDRLEAMARRHGHVIVRSPRHPANQELFEMLIAGDHRAAQQRLYDEHRVVVAPTTDDRPFKNQQLRFMRALFGSPGPDVEEAVQQASVRVLVAFAGGTALVLALFLVLAGRSSPRRRAARAYLVLFAALGVGFMLYEIVLVERASLILGHPTLGLIAVLTALLLALALGSAASSRWLPERSPRLRVSLAVLAVAAVLAVPNALPALGGTIAALPTALRWFAMFAAMLVCSLPLGFMLPTTLRVAAGGGTVRASSCWAVNGGASVLGTVVAALFVRNLGFQATALIATACYATAGALWIIVLRGAQREQ